MDAPLSPTLAEHFMIKFEEGLSNMNNILIRESSTGIDMQMILFTFQRKLSDSLLVSVTY